MPPSSARLIERTAPPASTDISYYGGASPAGNEYVHAHTHTQRVCIQIHTRTLCVYIQTYTHTHVYELQHTHTGNTVHLPKIFEHTLTLIHPQSRHNHVSEIKALQRFCCSGTSDLCVCVCVCVCAQLKDYRSFLEERAERFCRERILHRVFTALVAYMTDERLAVWDREQLAQEHSAR